MTKRLLVVDDEPHLLYSLQEFLTRLGYEVIPAESGTQALEFLVESPPDLIIADIMMEEMDGFEFQQRVNTLTGDGIPFVFLTAKGDLQDRLSGLRGGADDYVTKPFEPEELGARIAAVLRRVEQTRREEQREFDRLRARILAEVSSRLRAPAANLVAHLNLMLSERFSGDRTAQQRYLKNALKDGQVLSKLVDDLWWAAAGTAQDFKLEREPTRIAPIVRGSAASAARMAGEKGVELSVSCGGLLSGNVDRTALSRALSGLLESAVRLSPPESQVQVAAVRAGEGGLEFVVTDGGWQAHSGREPSSDLANALDFARRVAKSHGGKFGTRRDDTGNQSFVLWVPGRVAKHVGRQKR